ncbi:MAG: hypothetical protein ABI353_00875 [Isosphaeraceae bacterium]
MRMTLAALVRLSVLVMIGLCVVAVGLGRMSGPPLTLHTLSPSHHVLAPKHLFNFQGYDPHFFDTESGRLQRLELSKGEQLDMATCSPWEDEQGERQVAGRWSNRTGRDQDLVPHQFGLGRFTFPGGQPINRVATRIIPHSPVCWFPDTSARVLFVGGDRQIYRFCFEGAGGTDGGCDLEPQALAWEVEPPDNGEVMFGDLAWPTEPALGGRMLVSLFLIESRDLQVPRRRSELWWLQPDPDGSRIIAAGRFTNPEPTENDQRMPTVARSAEGAPVLAYLTQEPGANDWQLRVAPLRFDPKTGIPQVHASEAKVLAEDCAMVPLTVSRDSRTITCIQQKYEGGPPIIGRLNVPLVAHETPRNDVLTDSRP